jgi:hypothetical protein
MDPSPFPTGTPDAGNGSVSSKTIQKARTLFIPIPRFENVALAHLCEHAQFYDFRRVD